MILIGFEDILDLNKSEKNKKKTITAYLNLKLKDSHFPKKTFVMRNSIRPKAYYLC